MIIVLYSYLFYPDIDLNPLIPSFVILNTFIMSVPILLIMLYQEQTIKIKKIMQILSFKDNIVHFFRQILTFKI
jgi:hypothetical protein